MSLQLEGSPSCLWADSGVSCPGKLCNLNPDSRAKAGCGELAGLGMGLAFVEQQALKSRCWAPAMWGCIVQMAAQQGDVCVAGKARCQVRSGFTLSLSG